MRAELYGCSGKNAIGSPIHCIGHKASINLRDQRTVSCQGREERRDKRFQAQAEEPLGIDTRNTMSKRSGEWWLLIGQKMLCIIVPNRRTASPEFFCNFKTRLVCEICSSDVNMHKGYLLLACLKSKSRFRDV